MKRIVILGAGTGGTMMANRLVRALPDDAWRVTVVDRDDVRLYQPGLLFLPFDQYRSEEIVRRRTHLLDPRVELRLAEIDKIDPLGRGVYTREGARLAYDVLVVATGSRVLPEQTTGLTGVGWRETAFDFYTLEGALALRGALEKFEGGRLFHRHRRDAHQVPRRAARVRVPSRGGDRPCSLGPDGTSRATPRRGCPPWSPGSPAWRASRRR